MKKSIKILIFLILAVFLSVIGMMGYRLYQEMQKTPDEIIEIQRQKTQRAYEKNLEQALAVRENYEFIVVLNPAHGGNDAGYENGFGKEKDVTLAICNKVAELNSDASMGIFLTRTEDVGMDANMRLAFVERIQPDVFIDVHTNKSSSVSEFGTGVYYDTTYYNRKLNNAEFADMMEKSVVSAIEGLALGIYDVTEKEEALLLRDFTMPAISLSCGYMSNEKEGELLTRENYQENMAGGILEGIRLAGERLKK